MARIITLPPGIEAALEAYTRGLEALYGDRLASVYLFGSSARGDARPDSDIDTLVVLRGEVDIGREIEATSALRQEICLKHELVVSSLYISESDFQDRRSPVLVNIRREGIKL